MAPLVPHLVRRVVEQAAAERHSAELEELAGARPHPYSGQTALRGMQQIGVCGEGWCQHRWSAQASELCGALWNMCCL